MNAQPNTAINTRSGLVLDFAQPLPEAIAIDDVAGGLSLAPRFGGQALSFHSVAQHAINVAMIVGSVLDRPDLSLAALHHDSHEAYACDLPKPLKRLLGDLYTGVTDALDSAISRAFGFEWPEAGSPEQRAIKQADTAVFVLEARDLLDGRTPMPDVEPDLLKGAEEIVATGEHWTSRQAEDRFRSVHRGCVDG